MAAPATALLLVALAGCGQAGGDEEPEGSPVVEAPEVGTCRVLTPDDVGETWNDTEPVDCAEEHTAETFAVGTFPSELAQGKDVDDPALGAHIYATCSKRFQKLLGGDESKVMRSLFTWAWFRPTAGAWEMGARWYRCDVVGGSEDSPRLMPLPESTKGVLLADEDRWMTCVDGETVAGSEKISCAEPHTWRAVTTIKVGRPEDEYPGDRVVESRTRDFCSDSVGAWLNYPVDYDFGYTFFRKAEWETGNRRSICWAKTDQ